MNVIYIAGRYRGHSPEVVELNCQAAKFMALLAQEKGWFPLTPHLNTYRFELVDSDVGDDHYLMGTMELMTRCDAVLMVPGWRASTGAQNELQRAKGLKLPVYYHIDDLPSTHQFDRDLALAQVSN